MLTKINKISVIIFSLVLFFACSSSSKIKRPKIKREIPIEVLHERGIAPMHEKYKSNYFEVFSYFLYNKNDVFNEIQGDFFNVKYKEISNLNIMVAYFRKFGEKKQVLEVLLALTETSKLPLKDVPISVESSKHGSFISDEVSDDEINRTQQRRSFIKELNLENKYDVVNKIKDDVITVTVDGQIYLFLNPELELD